MRFAFRKVVTAVALFASTVGLATAAHHCVKPVNYKCEVPVCPTKCPCLRDGFYLGAGAGYNILTSNHDFNAAGNNVAISSNLRLAAKGWDAGGFLGYGKYFDNWYLAGEVYGFYTSASSSTNVTSRDGHVNVSTRENGDWGLAILPGVAINDATLGYVKIGYDWARANARVNATPTGGPTTTVYDQNNTLSGWLFGAGIETLVWCDWSVRGEFDYINYNHTTGHGNGDISDNRIWLSGIYHFMF